MKYIKFPLCSISVISVKRSESASKGYFRDNQWSSLLPLHQEFLWSRNWYEKKKKKEALRPQRSGIAFLWCMSISLKMCDIMTFMFILSYSLNFWDACMILHVDWLLIHSYPDKQCRRNACSASSWCLADLTPESFCFLFMSDTSNQ